MILTLLSIIVLIINLTTVILVYYNISKTNTCSRIYHHISKHLVINDLHDVCNSYNGYYDDNYIITVCGDTCYITTDNQ